MSVVDRPDEHTAAWWRQQYHAACYQQNVYAASIRELELRLAALEKRLLEPTASTNSRLESMSAAIGQLQERLDKAAQVVKALRQQPAGPALSVPANGENG